MLHKVAIIRQMDYEPALLEAAIKRAIDAAGFDLTSVRNKRVLLKPNMLGAYPVSSHVTTHPEFVAAAGRIFKKAGAEVWVGDSPNGVHPITDVWRVTGIHEICKRDGFVEKPFEAAGSEERGGLLISRVPLSADLVVNLPKFKTHSLTVMTLCVKNLFGCICGVQKSAFHRQHPRAKEFSEICARVTAAVKPSLNIVDGITAMEGNGPSGGPLKELGVIIAGQNPHAVDCTSCGLISLDPMEVDTIRAAVTLGLWSESEKISTAGDPFDPMKPGEFILPATYTKGMRDWKISHLVTRLLWGRMKAQPRISKTKCRLCGLCVKSCPVEAIEWPDQSKAPHIMKRSCIECFCCHEVCPHKAIEINQTVLLKFWRFSMDRRAARG